MGLFKLSAALVLGGLVWLGVEYAEDRARPTRHAVPAEAALRTATGTALGVRQVQLKNKKGVLAERYTELVVQAPDGPVTLRVGEPHAPTAVDGMQGQVVTAAYDPGDRMTVCSVRAGDRPVIAYRDSARWMQKRADDNRPSYWLGWLLVGLGVAGFLLGRRSAK